MPKISVLMTVYNGDLYLKQAINSVLRQSFGDFEFIVINDGSIDSSQKIIEEYANQDNRIRAIHRQQNSGISKSLNIGIKIAKGKFIAIQDADDISLSHRLEKQLEFLNEHHEYSFIGSNWYYIDEFNNKITLLGYPFLEKNENISKGIVKYNPFCHSSIFFYKRIIDMVGLYNEEIPCAQDYEFIVRVLKYYKAYNIKEALVLKRMHRNTISSGKFKQQKFCSAKIKLFAMNYLSLSSFNYLYVLKGILEFLLPKFMLEMWTSFKLKFKSRFKN